MKVRIFFEQNRIPQLPNLEKIMCGEVLTLEEITKALKLLPNNHQDLIGLPLISINSFG